MVVDQKYVQKHESILRDTRPLSARIADGLRKSTNSTILFVAAGLGLIFSDWVLAFGDVLFVIFLIYFLWLRVQDRSLPFKLPSDSKFIDKNNFGPGKKGQPEGILYLGNKDKTNEEVWFSNSDIRTHMLYLGTTGAGKTEGLKSLVTNALAWASGFVYVDGKADTDLWSSLSALVRRFGRDDDLLVLNYMTGNSDLAAPSNTMNPFSSGSASYLTNMLVSLMPESGGDNAMWKERAVSLAGSIMPVLTWKRDNQEMPLSVRTIRDYLELSKVIALSKDKVVPEELRSSVKGYLSTLPGFVEDAYDDDGKVKPPGAGQPQYDTTTANQQHGYLAMQFTRSLQSLGDDYGYIFDTQQADIDMVDVVLNRRILVVLVPALEKSGDEVANLGKIVAASIKGMMGATLGATVEGSSETVIENKPTHSSTPFMTVFDEVGYYVAEGMAVMAAQARSLGFSLVFAGQDLPAMKKRVREEAQSITANCNVKIFGKLEDPTETKDFFEKTVGSSLVTESSGFQVSGGSGSYFDNKQASVQSRAKADYDELRSYKEGQAIVTFGEGLASCRIFYSNPGFAKAMRVTRFMSLPVPSQDLMDNANAIGQFRDLMVNKSWTAKRADVDIETSVEIAALAEGFKKSEEKKASKVEASIGAVAAVYALSNELPAGEVVQQKPPAKNPPVEKTEQKEKGDLPSPSITTEKKVQPPDVPPAPAEEKPQGAAVDRVKEEIAKRLQTPVEDSGGTEQTQIPPSSPDGSLNEKDGSAAQDEPQQNSSPVEQPLVEKEASVPDKVIDQTTGGALSDSVINILTSSGKEAGEKIFKEKKSDKGSNEK